MDNGNSESTRRKSRQTPIFLIIASLVLNLILVFDFETKETRAAGNLLKNSSFETDLSSFEIWRGQGITRPYNYFRSYEAPFGQGSYSAAIESPDGAPGARFDAGLVGSRSNSFTVSPGKTYLLRFYAKSALWTPVSVYLENAQSFNAITAIQEQMINQDWAEYSMAFTPFSSSSEPALLNFVFGDMPFKNTLYLDGLTLVEFNSQLTTTEIKGYIGEEKKVLHFNDLSFFAERDLEIELPYYDSETGRATNKRFSPTSITARDAYFNMYARTYPGIGRVYLKGNFIGSFNYNVLPKVSEFYPDIVRADQELAFTVSGFNPVASTSHVVVKAIDSQGKLYDKWLTVDRFDSSLSFATVKLPYGIAPGTLFLHTSFTNAAGQAVENRTAAIRYQVKPVINSIDWASRGFEQVGDKLRLHGKGVSYLPSVNFYDDQNRLIVSNRATIVSVSDSDELIEVQAPLKANRSNVTVKVSGVESDSSNAVSFSARPRLNTIVSRNKRTIQESGQVVAAAKIGEEITLNGEGFVASGSPAVEFQGFASRFTVSVAAGKTDANGKWIKITVPERAQTGFIAVLSTGQKSNYLPLEIIPKVISVTPQVIEPNKPMTILAQGVGGNVKLAKVYFNLTDSQKIEIEPAALEVSDSGTTVSLTAPLAISNRYSSLNLQYDRWRDDEKVFLNVRPTITDANINLDTKVLTIRGYGFSINPRENVITYKYADENHTVITPKASILGVYPTEEGQEIRIQISDNYYYGYVSVTVGDFASNEANFGPVSVRKIVRRIEMVPSLGRVMGVLYISGYNFGTSGDVKVGSVWATNLTRSEFFITAAVEKENLYENPVIVTKR